MHFKKITFPSLLVFFALLCPRPVFPQENTMLSFDGITTPYETIEVGCSVVGVIEKMNVERSDFVEKNTTLCTLETNVERAQVELVKARIEMLEISIALQQISYRFARREFERKSTLFRKDAISFFERDEAETNMKIAENKLNEAMAQKNMVKMELRHAEEIVKRMIIKSPVSGLVVERYLTSGELVNEQPLLKLARLDPLYVETIIPARHWGMIKENTKASILPEIPLAGEFEGTVKIVDQIIDAESGMFGVRIELPNPEHELPAGMKCRVVFQLIKDFEKDEN